MADTKVDAQAVQAELRGIAGLMTEVTRLMGPQVWQGGSAGAFTTDLQGHNRSLGRMMVEILRTVSERNRAPMVLDPPDIPRVAPAQSPPGLASVSVTGLERLETALKRAADGLPRHGGRIRSLLRAAGPGAGGTIQCERTGNWCHEQAVRMRTRLRYALAENQTNPAWVLNGGMTRIPDQERLGPKEMAELGRLQATVFGRHLTHPDATSSGLLADIAASLRENHKNQAYLGAFFGNVPPGSVGKLAHHLHRRSGGEGVTAADKKVIGDMGTALAALSRKKENQATVTRALGPTGSDMPGQALLVGLSAPDVKWGSAVLLDLAKAALRWRQKYPSYEIRSNTGLPGSGVTSVANQQHRPWWHDWGFQQQVGDPGPAKLRGYDPALNVLGRIASQNDRTAARELAATHLGTAFTIKDAAKADKLTWLTRGTGHTYGALLVAPDWMDQGKAAGQVIKLATTPEKGHEVKAAQNAANFMTTVAWWNDVGRTMLHKALDKGKVADYNPLASDGRALGWLPHNGENHFAELGPGLRDGLLHMTRMYIPAIADADRTTSGTNRPNVDPVTKTTYVDIGGKAMQDFLRTLAIDDKSWAQLVSDTQLYRQRLYAWGLEDRIIGDAVVRAGRLEGNLIAAYGKERISNEELTKKQYEDAQKQIALLRDVAAGIIGATPAGNVGASEAFEIGTTPLLDKIKHSDFEKNVAQIKSKHETYSDQLYIDLARGYYLSRDGKIEDKELASLLRKPTLSPEEQAAVIDTIRRHYFSGGEDTEEVITGRSIIHQTQGAANDNIPPE
ncbi:hypothetical protein [Actinomadura rugatobispora]|uniref:WXG100 family type VII secretion target n=1 Tax=Actinomadura rugatobispora TaxID=1994 RepID=A0ABW1A6V5_9ACTN|nr:hypothetical protein GCM10010200_047440 [Actinomadura rugatobispora]